MENVTIVGTEDGVLVLATESGERFALAIDEVLRREVRKAQDAAEAPRPAAASPREIQKHIRAGLTAEEAAELLGVPLDEVIRFASPVIAEREHIIGQALAAPVLLGSEIEPNAQPTFGAAIRNRLYDLGASDEHWASWKDERGWTVKLEFVANEIAHDARWSFDPRSGTLAPSNADATQLSRQGAASESLIPRLRALDSERGSPYKDDSRFDSGAFGPRALPDPEPDEQDAPRTSPAAQEAAMTRAPEDVLPTAETADLLEALRRRRGQRETPPHGDDEDSGFMTDPISLFDALEDDFDEGVDEEPDGDEDEPFVAEAPRRDDGGKKRGRAALPSWDEIVFGARTED